MASAIVRPFAQWYFNKLTTRLAKMGMTYHDAIADTGVYDRAISRLPAEMKVRCRRQCAMAPVPFLGLFTPELTVVVLTSIPRVDVQVERQRRFKRASDLSSKHVELPASSQVGGAEVNSFGLHACGAQRARVFFISHLPIFVLYPLQENPWKDYKMVQHIFSETQKEHDERRFLTDRWW